MRVRDGSVLAIALLASLGPLAGQSFTGSLKPTDPNDVLLITFTVSSSTTFHVQSWGYGGSSGASGGRNLAGVAIPAGGFDPYLSLFSGTGLGATFLASNDDGSCPPGVATSGHCLDSTLHVNSLPAGTYTLALSVFENFSFAENWGTGSLGDLFIGLGNYYDSVSGTDRSANYAIDIAAAGLRVVSSTRVVAPPTLSKTFWSANLPVGGTTTLSFSILNPGLSPLTGIAFTDVLPVGLVGLLGLAHHRGLLSLVGLAALLALWWMRRV